MEMTPGGGALYRFFSAIKVALIQRGVPVRVSPRTKSELSAHQMSIGSCGVPGSLLKKSDMSSYQIALGSRQKELFTGFWRDGPGFHKGLFLVSSVSVLANEGTAKDFSLWDGDSWCAFPAGLPSSCVVALLSLTLSCYRRILLVLGVLSAVYSLLRHYFRTTWYWAY